MKKLLSLLTILVLLCISWKAEGQVYTQTYVDKCTGEIKVATTTYINGSATVNATTNATNTSSGALQVRGGAGIGGDLFASRIRTVSTTNATSTQTGEIIVQGGVGIGQNLYVGGLIVGTIAATVSTASQVTTIRQPNAATYYLTFVDSDNAS